MVLANQLLVANVNGVSAKPTREFPESKTKKNLSKNVMPLMKSMPEPLSSPMSPTIR